MAGGRLWKELVGDSKIMKVTSIQLAFTGLESAELGQQSIEGFFKTPDREQLYNPNNGESSLKRAREEEEDALPQTTASESDISALTSGGASKSFKCPRCGKRLHPADQFAGSDVEEDDRVKALKMLRMEHDDYHFAQDLARTAGGSQDGRQSVTRRKKKRKEPESIAKFFTKK